MPLPDILDLADFLMWWRLSVGIAVTGLAFVLALVYIPQETVAWTAAILIGLVGVALSLRWQHRADSDR